MGRFAIEHGSEINRFIAQAGSEAVEEMVQEVLDPILRTIATGDLHDGATIEEILYSGLLGGITAMGINTVDVAFNKVAQTVADKKAEAFTQNEQVVFDKIVESRIAELEAKGEKVTSAEKKNIKKSVRQEFENGEIATSDIEEALKDNWQPNVEQDKRIVQCYVRELEKKQAIKADFKEALKRNGLSEEESETASAILAESVVNNPKLKGETAESLSTESIANLSNVGYTKVESEVDVNATARDRLEDDSSGEGIQRKTGEDVTGRESQGRGTPQGDSTQIVAEQQYQKEITERNQRLKENTVVPNKNSVAEKLYSMALEEYGVETTVVSDSAWDEYRGKDAPPMMCSNGEIFVKESVTEEHLNTGVPHEATHLMKQTGFKPYLSFVEKTPEHINFASEDSEIFLHIVFEHLGLSIETINDQGTVNRVYDEVNATVFGEYQARNTKGTTKDGIEIDFYNVFYNFDEYIAELSDIHEQFKKYRKEKQDNSTKPDVNHIGGISAPSSKDVSSVSNNTNAQQSEKEKTLQEEFEDGGTTDAEKKNNTFDSFGITKPNDYIHVQRQVFNTLRNEGFFTSEDSRSRTDVNEESGMVVETNKSGIDETFSLMNYKRLSIANKLLKLETVRRIPEIIRAGTLVEDNVSNYHNAKKGTTFAYIEAKVEVDGKEVAIKIDIKKSPQKNKFWVHSINILEKAGELPADVDTTLKQGKHYTDYDDSVTDAEENVNSISETEELLKVKLIEECVAYKEVASVTKGVYTIVEEKNGMGKLKSGIGWINLLSVEKL